MSCSMTRHSDAGEARNRGPLVSSLNTKCGQSKRFGTGPGRERVQTFWPNTQLPPICIRAKIWAYTWVSEKFGHSNAKTQKTGHSYTFFIKKGGLYLAALKKGGIWAHILTMSYKGSYPPPPPRENVVRGDQKLCKRSPNNASLKLSKTYVKYRYFNMIY